MVNQADRQEGGFRPSDLQDLPEEQVRLLRFIMRNSGISHQSLSEQLNSAPELAQIKAAELDDHLRILLARGNLYREEINGVPHYRPKIRRQGSKTMSGIWATLASDNAEESPQTAINPELRRTRSALANKILADLSKESEYNYNNSTPDDLETAQETGHALMQDLFNTGRAAMAKREKAMTISEQPTENTPAPSTPTKPLKDSDNLMSDLVKTGKRATSMINTAELEKAEKGLVGKLLRAIGLKK